MENSNLFNAFFKIKRLAELSSTAGGMATRLLAEKYLGLAIDDQKYAQQLKNSLGEMRGPVVKVAQLLAAIPDVLPPEYANELLQLQSQAPKMGEYFVKRRMSSELGANWQQYFSQFDLQATYAASLGQVHQAYDLDGQKLACKLQYPNMQATLAADMEHINNFLKILYTVHKSIDHSEAVQEIKDRLLEETDYFNEIKNINKFEKIFADCEEVLVPKINVSLSTNRLLTMHWAEGENLLAVVDRDEEIRNLIADRLFFAWYFPFYHYGCIHGDPHMGNYLITKDYKIHLLDFGCVRYFKDSFIQAVLNLYYALEKNDQDMAISAYESWGFTNLNQDLIATLNNWAKILYEPLLQDCVRPIQEEYSSNKAWQISQQIYQDLRKYGGIKPPKEFVFMDRAAIGMGAAFMRLRVKRNWYQLFHQLITYKL